MGATFYEQVEGIAQVFDGWTVCERTVVLCALIRRVPWSSLKLVKGTIEAALSQYIDEDAQRLESDANDSQFLSSLLAVQDSEEMSNYDDKVRKLLIHLPLLTPGNEEAKEHYLSAIPNIVQNCVDTSQNTDECQQLLSYMLIHPGVNGNDRRSLGHWLRFLENHISGKSNKDNMWQQRAEPPTTTKSTWINLNKGSTFRRTIGKNIDFKGAITAALNTDEQCQNTKAEGTNLQESFSKNGIEIDTSADGEKTTFDTAVTQPKKRSNSLTPPMPAYIHMSSSAENLSDQYFIQKPRSFSLSSEHSLANLRAIGAIAASGSETRLDDLRSNNVGDHHEGMSNVGSWLKSLRLHKYIWLFSNISYDEMISIDEEYLEKLSVTKGARHKLLLSIKKLSERLANLKAMQQELSAVTLMSISSMNTLLDQLRNIIISPIKPTSKLSHEIVKVLDLASTRLLTGGVSPLPNGGNHSRCLSTHYTDEATGVVTPTCEPVSLHCWLVDKALNHEAFCYNPTLLSALKALKYRMPPRQFFSHLSDAPFARRPKPRWRSNNAHHHITHHTQLGHQPTAKRKAPPQWSVTSDWSNEDAASKTQHCTDKGKSSSYPSFQNTQSSLLTPPRLSCPSASLGDINSRLESLCLQMTEQAIN